MTHQAVTLARKLPVQVASIEKIRTAAHAAFHKLNPTAEIGTNDVGILVNYIRHKLSPYDGLIAKANAHPHGQEMAKRLRVAILVAIADRYAHVPAIAAEAKRQLTTRETKVRVWRAVEAVNPPWK